MSATETISPYSYTAEQSEVVRLHDLYRRCFLDQKYYAYQLQRYKRWDWGSNLIAAASTILSITGVTGQPWSLTLGIISALILVIRPLFKPAENIERYSRLHYGFTDLFYQIESLLADVRRHQAVTDKHRREAEAIIERFKNLAIQEDPSADLEGVAQFQSEVERAIPETSLWLPSA